MPPTVINLSRKLRIGAPVMVTGPMRQSPLWRHVMSMASLGRAATFARGHSVAADTRTIADCRQFVADRPLLMDLVTAYPDADNADEAGKADPNQRLLSDAEAGRIEVVVLPRLEQLGFDPADLARTLLRLDNAGVTVVSINDRFCSDASLVNILFPDPQ